MKQLKHIDRPDGSNKTEYVDSFGLPFNVETDKNGYTSINHKKLILWQGMDTDDHLTPVLERIAAMGLSEWLFTCTEVAGDKVI